jgi:phosphoribosylaminoimidazole-succinocarboxamide synthase
MTVTDRDRQALAGVLTDAHFPELPNFQRGKVRDSYDLPDGRRIMIATDRQSAFDQVLAAVPFKGQTLTQTARFWFAETADLCPNHVLDYPDPNVVVGRRLDMLPVEFVVRDYLTGSTETSIWPMYQRGLREVYGYALPDGLVKNAKLPATLITPTTKGAAGDHDRPVTAAEIIAEGLISRDLWDEAAASSLSVFARGREVAARQGLILVDTKFEFGLDESGRLVLADEILTPDSSRYWHAASYPERHARGAEPESLDKEFLRLWIRERCNPYAEPVPEIPDETLVAFSARYVRLFETVTGRSFQYPDLGESVRERVRAALAAAFDAYF